MKNGTNKRLSAVDAFIILLLIAAVVGVGFKVFAGNAGLFAGDEENYYISYVIESADGEVGKLVTLGSIFYFENGKLFGSVAGDDTILIVVRDNDNAEFVKSELKQAFGHQ